ncbi:MAG TPA: TadE/TadG family type IV pilus assembly protein [Pyrinomonadaceae bacterium]|nr:TadE/TadG family type IV pilus assembly protein [Pyrinomonadaceae bacterium]
MCKRGINKSGERGGSLIEFTIVASGFFMMLLAICAGSNLYFTHNVLVETARRGARFAVTQAATTPAGRTWTSNGCESSGPNLTAIQNYAIYGNTLGTGTNVLGLQPANICVEYNNFGVGKGSASVRIINFTFHFAVPFIDRQIDMPQYRSTQAGENAGT